MDEEEDEQEDLDEVYHDPDFVVEKEPLKLYSNINNEFLTLYISFLSLKTWLSLMTLKKRTNLNRRAVVFGSNPAKNPTYLFVYIRLSGTLSKKNDPLAISAVSSKSSSGQKSILVSGMNQEMGSVDMKSMMNQVRR